MDAGYAIAQSESRDHHGRDRCAYQDTDDENEYASDDDLKGRRKQRCVHVTVANPGDDREFDCDDGHGDTEGKKEVGDQKGQRVTDASHRGHQTANRPARPKDGRAR